MRNYNEALKYYQTILDIKLKYQPVNDPDIASTYENMAGVYHSQKQHDKMFEMYDKAIEILKLVLPSSYPNIEKAEYDRDVLQDYVKYIPTLYDVSAALPDDFTGVSSGADPQLDSSPNKLPDESG
ncbi:unnamed protein product [Didymodactylos carnosus]|uniref:Tetratricopeptide repeat protein n=1 Tax=Didymodactylos carnosus TaxID=1234261 RepID=A0A814VUV0_9BILA|nr:unnamed protein product [Didymodactylos carnosus]CAF1192837.1 unnamed protein product [Didymodactylos carnosus]CAF3862815.1 unnamed protein product [Didymodactylos carnosus]CAF3957060.1 unnamed protein product [Didymodactylos carnosus]